MKKNIMDLKLALELGEECGLSNVGDAVYNIKLKVGQLFEPEEYKNLIDECLERGVKGEDSIDQWLEELSE